jgi:hypothetical protein
MVFGSLVDTMILEPDLYEERFVVQPSTYKTEKTKGRGANKVTETIEKPWNLNSNTCKSIKAELEASGKQVISQNEHDSAKLMRAAILENAEAAVPVVEGKKQVSIVWDDEKTGIRCKGRFDILNEETIDDLKTARDASPNAFSRDIGSMLYHVQGAAYTDGYKTLTGNELGFRFIVVETSMETRKPMVALYELDNISMISGLMMFRRALQRVKHWRERGIDGYSRFFEPIQAPGWIVDREFLLDDGEVNFV